MLKRQRSSPSFFPNAYAPQEPSIDISERVVKRMRHGPPPQLQYQALGKGKASWRAGDSDEEEDVDLDEQVAGPSAPSEYQRLQHAGEYKDVNSLLHDLHAEQRHRMLFSTTSLPANLPFMSHGRPHIDDFFPSTLSKLAAAEPACPEPQHDLHRKSTSFTISIPSKEAFIVDHIEVQRVTQQYEDTNRCVRNAIGAVLANLDMT